MEGKGEKELPLRDSRRAFIQRTLEAYLKNLDDGRLPRDENGVLHALSVGCSLGYESHPIITVFPNSVYKGIDIEQHVKGAEMLNDDLPPDAVSFRREDARIVGAQERRKYGLVVVRNPRVSGSIDEVLAQSVKQSVEPAYKMVPYWREIFDSSIEKMAPRGFLLVTTGSEEERRKVVEYLHEKGTVLVLLAENNRAVDYSSPRNIDTNIIIAKRQA